MSAGVFSRELKSLEKEMATAKEIHALHLLDAFRTQMRELCQIQNKLPSDLWFSFFSEGRKGFAYMLGMTLSEYRAVLLFIYEQLIKGKGKTKDWKPMVCVDETGKRYIKAVQETSLFASSLGIDIVRDGRCGAHRYYNIKLRLKESSAPREKKYEPKDDGTFGNPFGDTNLSDEDYEMLMTVIRRRPSFRATQMLLEMTNLYQTDNVLKPVILFRGEDSNILVSPTVNQYNTHFVRTPVTNWQGSVDKTAGNALKNWNANTLKSFLRTFLSYEGTDEEWEVNAAELLDRILTTRYELKQGKSSVQQMSVPEVLAMARDAKLSDNGMNTLRKYLRNSFGRIVLPSKGRVSEYKKSLKVLKQEFKEFQVNDYRIQFAYIDPLETVHHIISKYKKLGECIIGESGSFGVNVQVDKGGGSVKFILLLASPCVEGQHFPTTIGTYIGKDDYDHLKAFFAHYNDSLRDMRKQCLLHIKRGEEWDYVLLPSEKYPPRRGPSNPCTCCGTCGSCNSSSSGSSGSSGSSSSGSGGSGGCSSSSSSSGGNSSSSRSSSSSSSSSTTTSTSTSTSTRTSTSTSSGSILYNSSQCLPAGLRFAPGIGGTVVLLDAEDHVLHTLPWSLEDIDTDLQTTYTPLQLFLSADLQAHSTLLGRENASGHFCPYCSSTKYHNADVNCNLPLLTLARLQELCDGPIAQGSKITQKPMLLDMIDPENRIVSTHLRLGIATHMLKALYLEVLRFEQMHRTEIRVAYVAKYALSVEMQSNRSAFKKAEADLNDKKKPADDQNTMAQYRSARKLVSDHTGTCAQADQAISNLTVALEKASARQKPKFECQLEEGRQSQKDHIANLNAAIAEKEKLRKLVIECSRASYLLENRIVLELLQDEILDYEKESANYAAAETTLALTSEAYKQKCAAYYDAEKTLKELLRNDKKEQNGILTELQQQVKEIIKKHGIVSAVWFGGEWTLQGENSWRLLQQAASYMPKVMALCQKYCESSAQENDGSHDILRAAFEEFSKNFQDASAAADKIYGSTEKVEFLNDDAFGALETAVQVFSTAWRKLGWSLTPKFHITEKHLLSMAATGYMGLMSEGIVERVHYYCNLYMPRTNNVRTWEQQQIRMHTLLELNSSPEVIIASWKLHKKTSRKNVRDDIPEGRIAKKSRRNVDSFAHTNPSTYQGSRIALKEAEFCMKGTIPKSEIK